MGHCCSRTAVTHELASDEYGRRRRYLEEEEGTMLPMRRRERRRRGGGGGGRGEGQGGNRARGRGRGQEEDMAILLPLLLKLFGPRQRNENDLRIIIFDINDNEEAYKALMDAIKVRQCVFAPELVGHNVPICPFPNPETGDSHFIIRLTDRTDTRFMVDLLFRDHNMYFIAFRRHQALSEVERDQREVNAKVEPGTWYRFANEKMPTCLNTMGEDIGLHSGHVGDKTTPGGRMVLREILITLSRYEDHGADKVALKKATQRVMVMFGEASRFRSVYNEIARRIQYNEPGKELSLKLWKFIHNWDVLSGKVYEMRLRGTIGLDTPLPNELNLRLYGFDPEIHTTMALLIGPEGELMLLHCNKTYLIEDDVLEQRMAADGSANVAEPNFQVQEHAQHQQAG